MLTHVVFFWLRPDLTAEQRARFETGVKSLLSIPCLVTGSVGRPASTDRVVIDRSYDFGLLTVFQDLAGHDAYQVDPIHLAFTNSCKEFMTRVQVYDFED